MRYYSTHRPVGPGTYPGGYDIAELNNFDERTFCEEIGREAWGYIDVNGEFTEREAASYELVPAGMKPYWCVVRAVYDDGRVTSSIVDCKEFCEKPEPREKSLRCKVVYMEWFDSREEAEAFVEEARLA